MCCGKVNSILYIVIIYLHAYIVLAIMTFPVYALHVCMSRVLANGYCVTVIIIIALIILL